MSKLKRNAEGSKRKESVREFRNFKSWEFSRQKRSERFISLFPKALKALGTSINTPTLTLLVKDYISLYEQLTRDEGKIYALRILKTVYGISQRFAVSHSFDILPFRKSDSDGYPLMVKSFKPFLQGSLQDRKCILCILQLFKLQSTECLDYSIDTIVKEGYSTSYKRTSNQAGRYFLYIGKCKPHLGKYPRQVARAWKETLEDMFPTKDLESRIEDLKSLNKVHISYKSGPNGPALGNTWKDFISLRDTPELINSIKKIAASFDNKLLIDTIDEFETNFLSLTEDNTKYTHSRLRLKQEAGAKVRVFAIGDLFTQWALNGLHHYCFRWLSKQSEDGTFDQDRTAAIVKSWGSLGIPNNSEDLTAATDSLPAQGVLWEIACQIVGPNLADEWINLLTNRDFTDPSGKKVRYGTGQPMGFKTSWALLAIWHHAAFRTVLKLNGIQRDPKDPKYVVIGDDSDCISILTKLYNYIVTELCEIGISPTKGFSDETYSPELNPLEGTPHLVVSEFAKRVFVNGYEVTPISPVLIQDGIELPSAFADLLSEAWRRDYFSSTFHPDVCSLALLGYQPDRAIQLASFPLWPALRKEGYWNNSEEFANSTCAKYLIWNKIPSQTLTHFTKIELAKLVEKATNESMSQLTDLIGSLRQDIELDATFENKFSKLPQTNLLIHVFNTLRGDLLYGLIENPGLAGDRSQFANIISKDLRASVQQLRVISDWRDLITEQRDYKKTNDRFEARFLATVYKRIQSELMNALPSF